MNNIAMVSKIALFSESVVLIWTPLLSDFNSIQSIEKLPHYVGAAWLTVS
ncbi:hypothetical protein O9H85_20315 [Paenibacillus filicis]|uniref:Uncharacterized protein n=1 Tax=Paenibacillus gyeongsangnamensis TaxID=3388067 RepID=A0ABT4QCW5_9BACL|nr:hypothetical protein [Paenibacillus filicis]MCZ8514727.1 hypothetical protein [Paenibacillus filicis]